MKTLGVGIVGSGGIARAHGLGWQRNAARGQIVAAADVEAARAQYLLDNFGAADARVYDGIESLLADPEVDIVDICLPHHLHTDAIIAAAHAGKAILCEKPLCTSQEDAAKIGAVLKETGVIFMMAHNQLFQPTLIEARALLSSGKLGKPFMFRSIEVFQHKDLLMGKTSHQLGAGESPWGWRSDVAKMGGGEVLDTGWHGTYRLLALAKSRPVEVFAMTERFLIPGLPLEDTGSLMVRFEDGTIGSMVTSWAFGTVDNWHFEIAAEYGSVAGSGTKLAHQLHGWPEPAVRTNDPIHSFTAEITHFLDVVQNGVESMAPFEQGARVLQVTKAAYLAAETHRAVTLPENAMDAGYVADAPSA